MIVTHWYWLSEYAKSVSRIMNPHSRWAHRIVQEYFEQTREEKEKALPVTMAFFDRETCNVPLTQVRLPKRKGKVWYLAVKLKQVSSKKLKCWMAYEENWREVHEEIWWSSSLIFEFVGRLRGYVRTWGILMLDTVRTIATSTEATRIG